MINLVLLIECLHLFQLRGARSLYVEQHLRLDCEEEHIAITIAVTHTELCPGLIYELLMVISTSTKFGGKQLL